MKFAGDAELVMKARFANDILQPLQPTALRNTGWSDVTLAGRTRDNVMELTAHRICAEQPSPGLSFFCRFRAATHCVGDTRGDR